MVNYPEVKWLFTMQLEKKQAKEDLLKQVNKNIPASFQVMW